MTLYALIGVSWLLVGLTLLALWLIREREPETQWRVLLAAAATPFVLFPLATVCRVALERMGVLLPVLDSLWPLAVLTAGGSTFAVVRAVLILRRQRALLASSAPPEALLAGRLRQHVAELSRAAGLPRPPRVRIYPRGNSVCVLGHRRPTIVISRDLLTVLGDPEIRGVLAHEIAHVRQRDYLRNWLDVALRSALFYLPPWSVAGRALAEAREQRADRLAVSYTADPLALAAALIKVWRNGPEPPVAIGAVGMLTRQGGLEDRVRKLLDPEPPGRPAWRAFSSVAVLVGGLLVAQTTVEGGTHLLARVDPTIAAWEECCDREVSPFPHCVPPRRVFLSLSTTACSRVTAARASVAESTSA